MLSLHNVSKSYPTTTSRKYILKAFSCAIPERNRIAILGPNGSGKTTLMRMLAGSEPIDEGYIHRGGRVSFPVGFRGTFHNDLSGADNVRFLANIYGMDPDEMSDWVQDFCEIGSYYRMPIRTYSSGMFAKIAFATSFAIDFDYYLVDEVIETGDRRFRDKCASAFKARLDRATLILTSHNFNTIRAFCDTGAVLHEGTLTFHTNLDDAFRHYEDLLISRIK